MMMENGKRARVNVIKQLLLTSVMLCVQIMVFFVFAGYISVRPWILFGASFIHYFVSTIAQYKLNPELLAVRLRMKRKGSKLWDEILMRISNLMVLIPIPAVAGLDVGRFHWSTLDACFVIIGLMILAVSTILLNWAMKVNPYFEPTVRIQKERGHQVITSGPYGIVRHPGYLAGILYTLSVPLIIGSAFTFIPVGIYIFLIAIRTSLEDRTLQNELNGYSEYTERVRYRLFPFFVLTEC
jgi:protein-S-isoprenylcysteine O-methyltransferase Ste14